MADPQQDPPDVRVEEEPKSNDDASTPSDSSDAHQRQPEQTEDAAIATATGDTPIPAPGDLTPDSSSATLDQLAKPAPDQTNPEAGDKSAAKKEPPKENENRGKDSEKLAMYKALAIKLKKELLKSREELTKLKESSQIESFALKSRADLLEKTLDTERHNCEAKIATLEAKVEALQQQLTSKESDLQSIQDEFESYRVMASKVMQQINSTKLNSNKSFEEERIKRLKELSDDQRKRISHLESQLETSLKNNDELSERSQQLQNDLDKLRERLRATDAVAERCKILSAENDSLKDALIQFRSRFRYSSLDRDSGLTGDTVKLATCDHSCNNPNNENQKTATTTCSPTVIEKPPGEVSSSVFTKDESQTDSNHSHSGSTSAHANVKPATFEIDSRSSVLDDPQNQLDNLTKAYLNSESSNSLLSEQVRALKEEIRRLQRGSERLVLVENLEYLKNVVFKFLTLDSSQVEQKQRLIPVLSTVLKLSPDETTKLSSLTIAERPGMVSSFFKL